MVRQRAASATNSKSHFNHEKTRKPLNKKSILFVAFVFFVVTLLYSLFSIGYLAATHAAVPPSRA